MQTKTKCIVAAGNCTGCQQSTCPAAALLEALPTIRELAADLAMGLGLEVLPGEELHPGVEVLIPLGMRTGTGALEVKRLQGTVKDGAVRTALLGGFTL